MGECFLDAMVITFNCALGWDKPECLRLRQCSNSWQAMFEKISNIKKMILSAVKNIFKITTDRRRQQVVKINLFQGLNAADYFN